MKYVEILKIESFKKKIHSKKQNIINSKEIDLTNISFTIN